MIKQTIARLFGQRKMAQNIDLSALQSVLLKPIGDAIGDAILHIAHLKQLKQAFPTLKVGVLVTERNKAIFQFSGIADELLEDNWRSYLQHRSKWQLYLDFMPTYTSCSIILDYWLKPEIVISFTKEQKKYYNRETVKNADFVTEIPAGTHIKDYLNCSVLASQLNAQIQYWLPAPANESTTATKLTILLTPQGSNRSIPATELAAMLQGIDSAFLPEVEIVLSNVAGCEEYLDVFNAYSIKVRLAEKTNLLGYFANIYHADLVISVDSAAVHIACAYAKPLLACYANNPQNYQRWCPNPQAEVATLALIGKNSGDNTQTKDFDIPQAARWLNKQFAELLNSAPNKETL